jgi:hypothetical protein
MPVFWMFTGGTGMFLILAESMGPTIVHFEAIADVNRKWRQGRCCGGCGAGRRGYNNVCIVGAMVASRLCSKFAVAFLVFKVEKGLKIR